MRKVEEKQHSEEVSNECLAIFDCCKAEFLGRFMAVDETRVHHFTPDTKNSQNSRLKRQNRVQRR